MAYQALYRTYRPQRFSEVVGQEAVTRTLANQVAAGRVGHAYLFSGPRGTGKTSIARIFARAMNCEAPVEGDACGRCATCRALSQENNLDILEIDAASNNGVDNIRDMRDNVGYLPANGRYRVYIIDEVHMLSSSAFNALLKTLEEPPAHAVFLMATTEIRKLPETVLSRCQRYEFRRLTTREITDRLTELLARERVEMEPKGVAAIARAAEGGMRDAISMLDQSISLSSGRVTAQQVYTMLGITDRRYFFSLSQALLAGDTARALAGLNTMLEGGGDVTAISQELLRHLRDLFLCFYVQEPGSVLSLDEEAVAQLQRQVRSAAPGDVLRMAGILAELEGQLRYASQPRVLLELALARCCRQEQVADAASLLTRIERLEARLAAGIPAAPGPEPATEMPEMPPEPPPADIPAEAPAPEKEAPAEPPAPTEAPLWEEAPPWEDAPPPQEVAPWEEPPAPAPVPEPAPAPVPEPASEPVPEPAPSSEKVPVPEKKADAPAYVPIDSRVASRVKSQAPAVSGEGKTLWSGAMERMRKVNFMASSQMRQGTPLLEGDTLRVIYTPPLEFCVQNLEKPETKKALLECLAQEAGRPIQLTLTVEELSDRQQAFVEESLRKLPKGLVEIDYEA